MRAALLAALVLAAEQAPERPGREIAVVHGRAAPPEMLAGAVGRGEPLWIEAGAATPADLGRRRLVLAGTPQDNPWIADLEVPGLSVGASGFSWRGVHYEGDEHLLQMRVESPWRPGASLELILGAPESPVGRRLADVHVQRGGRTILLGFGRGEAYEERRFETAAAPLALADGLRVFLHAGAALEEPALGEVRRALGSLAKSVDLHLYPSLEVKGLVTGSTRSVHRDGAGFHAVWGFDDRPARFIAEALADDSGPALLRRGRGALSMLSAERLDAWDEVARRLLATSEPPDPAALLDDAVFAEASPIVADAVAISLARFAEGRDIPAPRLAEAWLRTQRARASDPTPLPARAPRAGFHRGFTFAHEGYRIHDGYLSAKARASLSRLRELSTDAVAIVPYAFMPAPDRVVPLDVPTRPGSETDEDVVQAIRSAHALGMTVLLKPQIWIRGSWPGDIEPSTAEDEERFFCAYRRWIAHYALIAEAEGVELLAIGTELSRMTRGRRPQWARIIADVRALYRGELVYAANWGEEVEGVDFWDLLDYVGVDFYYPLSFEEEPTDAALRRGFDDAVARLRALHERHRKPVLFTEIGYASTRSPWTKPHVSHEGVEASGADQARAYEIALAAVAENSGWIRGLYWWKWPTDLRRGGDGDRSFTPNGKPAAEIVGRWYRSRIQ